LKEKIRFIVLSLPETATIPQRVALAAYGAVRWGSVCDFSEDKRSKMFNWAAGRGVQYITEVSPGGELDGPFRSIEAEIHAAVMAVKRNRLARPPFFLWKQ